MPAGSNERGQSFPVSPARAPRRSGGPARNGGAARGVAPLAAVGQARRGFGRCGGVERRTRPAGAVCRRGLVRAGAGALARDPDPAACLLSRPRARAALRSFDPERRPLAACARQGGPGGPGRRRGWRGGAVRGGSRLARLVVGGRRCGPCGGAPRPDSGRAGAAAPDLLPVHACRARRAEAAPGGPGRTGRDAGAGGIRLEAERFDAPGQCRPGGDGPHAPNPAVGHLALGLFRRGNRSDPGARARAPRARGPLARTGPRCGRRSGRRLARAPGAARLGDRVARRAGRCHRPAPDPPGGRRRVARGSTARQREVARARAPASSQPVRADRPGRPRSPAAAAAPRVPIGPQPSKRRAGSVPGNGVGTHVARRGARLEGESCEGS